MKNTIFIITLYILLGNTTAYSAGFDCKYARIYVERMICENNTLSSLDNRLNEVYRIGLNNDRPLKNEQIEWMVKNRNLCNSVDCITSAYINRIEFLEKKYMHPKKQEVRDPCSTGGANDTAICIQNLTYGVLKEGDELERRIDSEILEKDVKRLHGESRVNSAREKLKESKEDYRKFVDTFCNGFVKEASTGSGSWPTADQVSCENVAHEHLNKIIKCVVFPLSCQ